MKNLPALPKIGFVVALVLLACTTSNAFNAIFNGNSEGFAPKIPEKSLTFPHTPSSYLKTNATPLAIDAFTVNAGSDTISVCPQSPTTIGPSGFDPALYTFSWSPVAGLSDATIAQPTVTVSSSTKYTLTVTEISSSTSAQDSVFIKVKDIANIVNQPDTTICLYDTVFVKLASVSNSFSYLWTPNISISNNKIAQPALFPTQDTLYTVTVTDTNGCTAKDSIRIRVIDMSVFLFGFPDGKCPGDTVAITIVSPDDKRFKTIQWSPTTAIVGPTNTLKIKATPLVDTKYTVKVIDTIGCAATSNVYFRDVSEILADAGNDTTICIGTQAQLGSTPQLGYSYYWQPSSLNDISIANPLTTTKTDQKYKLIGANKDGCTFADSVRVSIRTPIVFAGKDTTICANTTASLMATSASAFSYKWTPSASLDKDTIPNPKASPLLATPYILQVTDSLGCQNTDTIQVNIYNFVVTASADKMLTCPGKEINIDATASGATNFSWSPAVSIQDPALASTKAFLYSDTKLFVTAKDNKGCLSTDSLSISVSGISVNAGKDVAVCTGQGATLTAVVSNGTASTYSWQPGSSVSNPALATVTTVPATGLNSYIITVTDINSCSNKDTVVVTTNPLPVADAGSDPTNICMGDKLYLGNSPTASGNSPFSFNWLLLSGTDPLFTPSDTSNPVAAPSTNALYQLIVTDNNGCKNKDSIQVIVNAKPIAAIIASSYNPCEKDSSILSVDASNSGKIIQWYKLPSTIPVSTATSYTVKSDGKYWVSVTEPGSGCSDSASTLIYFTKSPAGLAIAPVMGKLCTQNLIPLSVTATDGDNLAYLWASNMPRTFADSSNPNTYYQAFAEASATITAKAYNACDTLISSQTLAFTEAPNAAFTASSTSTSILSPISFTPLVDSSSYSRTWNFGDSSTDTAYAPSHAFSSPGTYTVTLSVQDSNACTNTYSIAVEVTQNKAGSILYVPNVFYTSASNTENRVCKVYGENIALEGFDFKVFNRWGTMIFSSTDFKEMNTYGWDGIDQTNSTKQQNGVYTYTLKGKYTNGTAFKKTGTITIIQ